MLLEFPTFFPLIFLFGALIMVKRKKLKVISVRLDADTIAEIRLNKGYTVIIRKLIADYMELQKVA